MEPPVPDVDTEVPSASPGARPAEWPGVDVPTAGHVPPSPGDVLLDEALRELEPSDQANVRVSDTVSLSGGSVAEAEEPRIAEEPTSPDAETSEVVPPAGPTPEAIMACMMVLLGQSMAQQAPAVDFEGPGRLRVRHTRRP
jgi:hypothetical protein